MEGDGDLVRSERWGVKEQMEVDFGLIGLILGLRKTKEKINEGKRYTGLRPRLLNAA